MKELCGEDHACERFQHRLQECNNRVNSKAWTKETCNEELLEFLHCVDECVRELIKKISSLDYLSVYLVVTTHIQIFKMNIFTVVISSFFCMRIDFSFIDPQ